MFQAFRRVLCGAVVTVVCSASIAMAVTPKTIFKDDFQSDTAVQTGDTDPVIGAGDVGGIWNIKETVNTNGQVINDTIPGNGVAGTTENYLKMARLPVPPNPANSITKPYATGWTTSDTLDRTVQLDFSAFQPTSDGELTVWLINTAPPSSTGQFPLPATQAVGADLDTEVPDGVWYTVRIIANLSSSETQFGILPQRYTLSIDSGAPSDFPFPGTVNQIQSVGFYDGGAAGTTEYIDNVQFQILNPLAVDGDYSGNGVVDGADYVVWRKNKDLMGGATPAQGDGTGDGNVLDDDYTYWRERFGNPTPGSGAGLGSSTIPEPASALLLALGACISSIVVGARRRHKATCCGT